MSQSIEKIIGLLKNPQVADRSLWEAGAYPQKGKNGEWRVSPERLVQFMDSYFARTDELSGNTALNFNAVPSFRLTNETGYPAVLSRIQNIGGAYIGVGAGLGPVFASEMSASHAFMVDCNAGVPYGFIPLYGALLAMAPTRAHFVSLVMGYPFNVETLAALHEASGTDIIFAAQDQINERPFRQTVDDSVRAVIGMASESENAAESAMEWLLAMRKNAAELYKLNRENGSGSGGPLVSERNYARHRDLFLSGRVTGAATDMAATNMMVIKSALAAMRVPLRLLYVSNVETWISDENDDLYSFYENLGQFASRWNPLLISSLFVQRPVIFDLTSYIARAIPIGLPRSDAAQIAEAFRAMRRCFIKGKTLSLSMPDIFKELRLKYSFGQIHALIEDIESIFEGESLSLEEFHSKMLGKSEFYRDSHPAVRDLILLNMMDAGIVKPPYPVLYGNGSLSVTSHKENNLLRRRGGSGSVSHRSGPAFFKPESWQSMPASFLDAGAGMTPMLTGNAMLGATLGSAFAGGLGVPMALI